MTSKSLVESLGGVGLAESVRPARQYSLRRRLPLLIFALVGALGGVFSWMAYHEVNQALRISGAERLTAAGAQVAELLGQSAAARLADAKRLAADPEIVERVRTSIQGRDESIPAALQSFTARNRQVVVRLYDAAGQPHGRAVGAGSEARSAPDDLVSRAMSPAGISPLGSAGGRVSYHTTVTIQSADASAPIGFLSVERSLSSGQAVGLIARLIGADVELKLGNATGDLWTDLSAPVAAPPATSAGSSATYTNAAGIVRLGAAVAVPNTPWLLWTDIPEATTLSPARTLLRRMLPITIVLTALGALAVYAVSGRITNPLDQIAQTADAIAAGDYSRRVEIDRGDELGRLAAAFNVMASRVAESRDELEARVHARTAELERAQKELDQFFCLSLDLLCIATTDGKFRRVNPAWEDVLGWTSADLTSVPYIDLVHPDDRAATISEAAKLADGWTTRAFENRYRTKDGAYRWLSWKSVSRPHDGTIYAAARDITDQKQTERALHQSAAELASANRELEAFSYSVSHDLRAPLRSIDGFAQALAEDYQDRVDETGRDYLSRIRAAAQRMGMLIDDLLSLSRVSRAELSRADVDLSAMVREVANRLGEQDATRRVDWRIEPDVRVHGDARLLRVAIDNLLGNAWKFTGKRDDARIEFGARTLPEHGRVLFVRDNGAGFDMAHAGKLFGAFQRLHRATEFPGTGVGLAIVQRIIRRHAGQIWTDASVGQGATFFFTLEAQ